MEKALLEKKAAPQNNRDENGDFNNLMADANYDTYKSRFDQ